MSPTSPSASSSVPSLSQDSHMSGRHAEDRDRASPIATAAGSSQCRDSTSSNNSTNIGSSSSSKRLDGQSRESIDGKTNSSSSQSRTHSHGSLRNDGHGHQEKFSGSHRDRENTNSSGSHRRSSHVSPELGSRRDSLEIKRESTDSERALKEVSAKSRHTPPRETKIKDEKSDTDTNRLDDNKKKQEQNSCNNKSQPKDKVITKDRQKGTISSEKVPTVHDTSGKTDSGQISSLSIDVDANNSDNVKTERISPVASTGENKTEIKACVSEEGNADLGTSDGVRENTEATDNLKEIAVSDSDGEIRKESEQVDKDLTFLEEERRKSTDSSSVRSEPIDIRPQRDVKESTSPDKMGSKVSFSGNNESNIAPEDSPTDQKDSNGVKQEKSPGPAKVLTASSGGVVYAMYPAAGQ